MTQYADLNREIVELTKLDFPKFHTLFNIQSSFKPNMYIIYCIAVIVLVVVNFFFSNHETFNINSFNLLLQMKTFYELIKFFAKFETRDKTD